MTNSEINNCSVTNTIIYAPTSSTETTYANITISSVTESGNSSSGITNTNTPLSVSSVLVSAGASGVFIPVFVTQKGAIVNVENDTVYVVSVTDEVGTYKYPDAFTNSLRNTPVGTYTPTFTCNNPCTSADISKTASPYAVAQRKTVYVKASDGHWHELIGV